jgi:hypothetical protein
VGLILLMPSAFEESVSYRTHAIGFVVGIAAAVAYFGLKREEIRAAEVAETEPEETLSGFQT